MNARQGAWLLAIAALGGCGQREQGGQAAAPASAPASAAASAASAPASSAQAPAVLAPQQVQVASAADPREVAAGQQLATQGAPSIAACAGCHGQNGEGNAQTGFPRLAGQGRLYLLHQLDAYADGSRKNAVMQPIAAAMNADQRRAAAAFYASQGQPPAASEAAPRASEPVLAVQGDDRRQIQGCANCHGPQGVGDAAANPYLAGQHPNYLAQAMREWKSGERQDDPSGQMPTIAKALTDEEVKTLVAHYAGLPPPAPRNAQAAPEPLSGQRAAVQSGPAAAAATPQQGAGTEQGAATTGGAQGQGAGGAATNPQQAPGTGR